jgi:hypothetical protein
LLSAFGGAAAMAEMPLAASRPRLNHMRHAARRYGVTAVTTLGRPAAAP